MTDHVPNEWHAHKMSVVCFYGTRRIQIATTRQPLFTPEAQAANARLIAAAPDMLEALDALYELCLNAGLSGAFKKGITDRTGLIDAGEMRAADYLKRARAAIAKATGKEG